MNTKAGWLGLIVGIPLAGLFANCCWVVFANRVCPVLMSGVACLIGILMGYLVFAPNRGCMRLPVEIERIRGWCVVLLVAILLAQVPLPLLKTCRSVATYVSAPCPPEGLPAVNISPALFLCFSPPVVQAYWHIMQMTLLGVVGVMVLRIVILAVPRIPTLLRLLWGTVSPGWSWLSVGCLVLLAVLSFFVEPLIHFGVLEPLSVDAAGIAEIDDLVRRQDVIRAGDGTPPNEGLDSERTRKHLLMLYAKYGACCEPGHEHISRAELAKFSPVDREILTGIMKDWERSQALALLEKTR